MPPSASHDEVRSAYREQALLLHPDRHAGGEEAAAAAAEARMREVNEAWQVLGDPVARASYDAELVRIARRSAGVEEADAAAPVVADDREDDGEGDERWPAEGPTSCLGPILPLLILVGLLLAIVVFTAYAKTG